MSKPPKPTFRGRVKFFTKSGWGGIESDQVPGDVYVSNSVIDSVCYRELVAGEEVEFRFEEEAHGTWRYQATWVRRLGEHPGTKPSYDKERGCAATGFPAVTPAAPVRTMASCTSASRPRLPVGMLCRTAPNTRLESLHPDWSEHFALSRPVPLCHPRW